LRSTPSKAGRARVPPHETLIASTESTNCVLISRDVNEIPDPAPPVDNSTFTPRARAVSIPCGRAYPHPTRPPVVRCAANKYAKLYPAGNPATDGEGLHPVQYTPDTRPNTPGTTGVGVGAGLTVGVGLGVGAAPPTLVAVGRTGADHRDQGPLRPFFVARTLNTYGTPLRSPPNFTVVRRVRTGVDHVTPPSADARTRYWTVLDLRRTRGARHFSTTAESPATCFRWVGRGGAGAAPTGLAPVATSMRVVTATTHRRWTKDDPGATGRAEADKGKPFLGRWTVAPRRVRHRAFNCST
jgi:hypothetical protein